MEIPETAPDAPVDEQPSAAPEPVETGALPLPETNAQGFAMLGGYPVNLRLRAEALSDAGEASDPNGLVPDSFIAAAGTRLAAERAEEAAKHPPVSERMTRDQLVDQAGKEGVAVEDGHTKADIVANIETARGADQQ